MLSSVWRVPGPGELPADLRASVHAAVLDGEVRATTVRLGLGVLGCVAVLLLWSSNAPAASFATLTVGGMYALWAFYAHGRARDGSPVRGWIHAIVDQAVVALASALSLLNHSGGYEALLAPLFPLLHVLWIGISALRHSVVPPLVGGVAAALSRTVVLLAVVSSGTVRMTHAATYGAGAVGWADQWTIIAVLPVAGIVTAWVAHSSRSLLVRAARDQAARTEMARAQASTKVDLTVAQANEASYRAAFEFAPVGLALLTSLPELRVFRVNHALVRALGWSAEEIVGRPLHALLVDGVLPDTRVGRDLVVRRRDGAHVTMRVTLTLTVEAGQFRHVLARFIPAEEAATPAAHGAPRARATERSRALEGVQVLLAEDDVDLLEWIVTVLRAAGAQVVAARDLEEARAWLGAAETKIDAAVIDVGLPAPEGTRGAGGLALADEIVLARPGVHVVLASGVAPAPGPYPILVKPFTREALIAHLALNPVSDGGPPCVGA